MWIIDETQLNLMEPASELFAVVEFIAIYVHTVCG